MHHACASIASLFRTRHHLGGKLTERRVQQAREAVQAGQADGRLLVSLCAAQQAVEARAAAQLETLAAQQAALRRAAEGQAAGNGEQVETALPSAQAPPLAMGRNVIFLQGAPFH